MPYLFQVQEDKKVFFRDTEGDNQIIMSEDWDREYPFSAEGIKNWCGDNGVELPEAEDLESVNGDYISFKMEEWLDAQKMNRCSYNVEKVLTNSFFTAKGCQNHIKQNHYHYKNPTDYLSHAFRNPEMELIYKFICELSKCKIHK